MDNLDKLKLTFQPKTVKDATTISLSGLKINGDKASTITFSMTLTDPITPKGTVRIYMPKANQQFLELGSS
jgi:hypothetical protein